MFSFKNKIIVTIFLTCLTLNSQVIISDGDEGIIPSSESVSLELKSNNKSLVVTRVNGVHLITNPINGMIIYDKSSNCLKSYYNNGWSGCLTETNNSSGNLSGVTVSSISPYSYSLPTDFPNPLSAEVNFNNDKFELLYANYDNLDFTVNETYITFYVNYLNGNDNNIGTSIQNALKTFDKAIEKANNANLSVEIILLDEIIGVNSLQSSVYFINKSIKIKSGSPTGKTKITKINEENVNTFNWVNNNNGTYSSSINQVDYSSCFDSKFKDENNAAKPMYPVNSMIDLNAIPGTFYFDNTTMHVHMYDNRKPDNDFIYNSDVDKAFYIKVTNSAATILLEGLDVYTNNHGQIRSAFTIWNLTAPNTSKIGIKNCGGYGSSGNAFQIIDFQITVVEDSYAKYNRLDGFNYHSNLGFPDGKYMTVYEHNVKSRKQGFGLFKNQPALSYHSQNGSTAHDNMNILRVNCVHTETYGPVVADVDSVYSINYGVSAYKPNIDFNSYNNACFYYLSNTFDPDSIDKMILIGCRADNSSDDIGFVYSISNSSSTSAEVIVNNWLGVTNANLFGLIKNSSGITLNTN
jgi:hypothetical protein